MRRTMKRAWMPALKCFLSVHFKVGGILCLKPCQSVAYGDCLTAVQTKPCFVGYGSANKCDLNILSSALRTTRWRRIYSSLQNSVAHFCNFILVQFCSIVLYRTPLSADNTMPGNFILKHFMQIKHTYI